MTCWEKAHSYYIPNGLFRLKDVVNFNSKESPTVDFNVVSKINWSSSLAKERKKQLKDVMHVGDKPPAKLALRDSLQEDSQTKIQHNIG